MTPSSPLLLRLLPALLVVLGMASALVLQHLLGWLPCPLCILQRISAIGLTAALAVWAFRGSRSKVWGWGSLAVAGAFAGVGVAAGVAHLMVLANPQTESCGPGIERFVGQLVDYIPGSAWLLEGAGSCSTAEYELLGVPLPAASLLLHVAAIVMALLMCSRRRHP